MCLPPTIRLLVGSNPTQPIRGRSASTDQSEVLCQLFEFRRGAGEKAGHQHVPVILPIDHGVEFLPCPWTQRLGEGRGGLHIHQSVGNNRQVPMLSGNVEMVNEIAHMILIRENPGLRTAGQLKGEASLRVLAAGLTSQLTDALPNRARYRKGAEL